MIESYQEDSNMSIYIPNFMLPTYVPGTPIQFIVNPYLVVDNGGVIVANPMDMVNPTLASLAVAPLYNLSDASQSVTSVEKKLLDLTRFIPMAQIVI